MVEVAPRITVDPGVRFGKPVVRGTRVPVDLVLGKLSSEMTFEEIEEECGLEREDILAVLAYAAKVVEQEQVRVTA